MKKIKEYYEALEQNRIKAYYQPQFSADSREVVSAEALCRMVLKDGSVVMPGKFIQKLEYTGEICSLDWLMVKKACGILSEMRCRGVPLRRVAVNFSRRHVEEWDAAERLCGLVDLYALKHELIEIEITETCQIHDFLLVDMIKRIRKEGFPVAVDDFGRGSSSLGFIRENSFDALKIDKTFLCTEEDDEKTRILLEGIIRIADKLGVRIVAEGVESREQADFLKNCGCNILQGDYLSGPLTEHQYLELLGRQ
ncbi:MAG: EAL domain-containing protein [Lachnospiraceae bacterium]|nr:EAL domain-containing protein [Lachnospiraceae bacterium]